MAGYLIGETLRLRLRETIDRVREMPEGERPTRVDARFEDIQRPGSGLRLGKTVDNWPKNSLGDVVVYGSGTALQEAAAAPPVVLEDCVNKLVDVGSGKWVIVGKIAGRWYLVSPECG